MQFKGGYRYPDLASVLTVIAGLLLLTTTLAAWWLGRPLGLRALAALACGLFGVALLGAAFTPVGLLPPEGNLLNLVRWFFRQQAGVTVEFTQWAFYLGLILLAVAAVAGALG
jgi:hypothetical protein